MESLLTSHKIPIYIGFSLSDTHNELLVLLTATQIILWWLSVQLSPWQNFETFVVQLHLCAQSSQSSSLDPKFNASYNFSRVVLLFTRWSIKSRTSCGENPPCAASGALCCSCSILGCAAPLPAAGNAVCWCWMELRRSHLPALVRNWEFGSGRSHPSNDTLKPSF